MHYNGIRDCETWWLSDEVYSAPTFTISDLVSFVQYPNVSSYYYDLTTHLPVTDLNFGRPKEWYFTSDNITDFLNASSAYNEYYLNQITELTDPNIYQIQAYAYLNELDINSLDLRRPLFIDMGTNGQGYLKLLSVVYENNYTPAQLVFQKIDLSL